MTLYPPPLGLSRLAATVRNLQARVTRLEHKTAGYLSNAGWVFPSGDTTGATDTARLQGALGKYDTVTVVAGTYYVTGPIVIPDATSLIGPGRAMGIPTGNYGAGSLPLAGAIIRAVAGFSGAALIELNGTDGTQHGGQVIEKITFDGSQLPAGNSVHGIYSQGFVAGVTLRDVLVWGGFHSGTGGLGGNGLYATNDGTSGHNPDFWAVDHCKFSDCGSWGVNVTGLADSWFDSCESTGNGTGGGWSITEGADTRWTACRADSNGGVPGWDISISGSANLQFSGCEANLNGTGWVFAGSGSGNVFLSNCIASGNTTAPTSYAGTNVVRTSGGNFNIWIPLSYSSAPATPWANSGSGPNAGYSWEGNYINVVADTTAGTVTAGTAVFTLPGVLAHVQQLQVMDLSGVAAIGRLNVGTGGTATFDQVVGTVATGNRCYVSGRLAVDA